MAGIYIHIPFCKQACHYCDFHFSTQQQYRSGVVDAMVREIVLRSDELKNEELGTIYFGGGTPSILNQDELSQIFNAIEKNYSISSKPEITLEANPDDINNNSLDFFNALGVNRLSIGIQSFEDSILKWMNRSHTSQMSESAIKTAQDKGFDNITIDLIYGVEQRESNDWNEEITKAIALNVPHISAYHLTIEKGTVFGKWHEKGKLQEIHEKQSAEEFRSLVMRLKSANFQHYEISNFAQEGMLSKHNTSYWLGGKYIGIGPSAHSFDGKSRRWNLANNHQYVKALKNQDIYFESEKLSDIDQYNELVMTRLRTFFGLSIKDVPSVFQTYFLEEIKPFLKIDWVVIKDEKYYLTNQGKLRADHIASELFFID